MKNLLILFISVLFIQVPLAGQKIPHANFQAPWGVKVNTYNGNLFFARTDLVLPNQGLSIEFTFAYNSFRDTIDIGYGKGWSSTYSLFYEEIGTDSFLVTHVDGRRDLFVKEDGTFQPPVGIFDTWEEYELNQYRLTTKHGMVYFFENATHRSLTRVEDPNGNEITLIYDVDVLSAVVDASGRSIELEWADGHLAAINDMHFPGGRSIQFNYTDSLLLAATDPEGGTVTYAYNEAGSLTSIMNEVGDDMVISYNSEGRVAEIVTCLTYLTFTYNPDQGKFYVTEKNPEGDRVTTYDYDEEGRLIQKSGNCCGYNMAFQYDADNNINERTDANGNSYTANHDDLGNPLVITDANGAQESFAFDATLNRLQNWTDKTGSTYSFEYDGSGNLIQVLQPEGVQIIMEYDSEGNLVYSTNGNGNETSFSYNSNNDLTLIDYPIGSEVLDYDGAGNLLTYTDGNGNSIHYSYDKLNRVRTIMDDLDNVMQFDYDAASNLTSEIDANENLKEYGYDAHFRLESVNTTSGFTSYGYDASDNLVRITDANTHTTSFAYDQRDLLVSETDPEGNTTSYSHDGNGNIISRTDANGLTTIYTYDNLNRLVSKTYGNVTDSYTYDLNGNLMSCSNQYISMSFTYDGLNRLISKTIDNWGVTISYEYDFAGNRTKMTDPSGETYYTYDGNNRLTSITNPSGELTEFTYDDGDRITRMDYHNGTYTEYDYDVANRLTTLEHKTAGGQTLGSYTYTYDANGNRLSMTTLEGTVTYSYDGDNRLMSATYQGIPATDESYEYDGAGNRIGFNGISYNYDAADRLQTAGSIEYQFDATGNLIQRAENGEVTNYQYDGENRLVKVILPDGTETSFQYDPFGNRISRESSGTTTRYLLDGENLLMELDASGDPLARYTAALTLDSWISMERDGESYFYHTDALGSVTALTGADQSVEAFYRYDAYGNMITNTSSISNPFTYTGREYDETTGLYYYRTRYYDSEVGRFLTKDRFPGFLGRPLSLNNYAYVEGNPINFSDPEGEFVHLIPVLIKAGLALWQAYELYEEVKSLYENAEYLFSGFYEISNCDKLIKRVGDKLYLDEKQFGQKAAKKVLDGLAGKINKFNFTKGVYKYVLGEINEYLLEKVRKTDGYKDFIKACQDLVDDANRDINPWLPGDGSQDEDKDPPSQNPLPEPSPDPPSEDCPICVRIIDSQDPNEIAGPAGCGLENWVAQDATLPFTIFFENDPDFATAPAQTVLIEHAFDPEINPFSFRLGDFGFGNYYFQVPDDVSYYYTQIDLSDSLGVLLDVTAGVNFDNNNAFWIFESRDPATGLSSTLPADVGFLPVNDTLLHNGEGFVNFTVVPSLVSETSDTIHAQAEITFDDNPVIPTNETFNLIDADHPVSQLDDIEVDGNEYHLSWTGTDEGGGISYYVLYASENGGSYLPVADQIQLTEYTFTGNAGSSYEFFTIAVDCTGNVEPLKDSGCLLTLADTTLVYPTGEQANGSIGLSIAGGVGGLTFLWEPAVSTDSIASGLAPGTYLVTVTDELGCTLEAEILLENIPTGADKWNTVQPKVFIYEIFPVPAREGVYVTFTSSEPTIWLEVFEINGARIMSQTIKATPGDVNQQYINLENYSPGSYLIRLRTRERSVSGVVVKQ